MSVLASMQEAPAPRQPAQASTVVISSEHGLQTRIAAALVEHDLGPRACLDEPGALAGLELGEAAIIVFCCDVEAPREMTSLRQLCRRTRGSAVVVVSARATATGVRRTLDAGAEALVFEPEIELTLCATIRAVASGQSVVPRKLRAGVEKPTLSHREHQILELVRDGLTNAEIADILFLAESTVKSHLASSFAKFGVHSRKEAVAAFVELKPASPAV